MITFQERLKELREEHQYKQEDMAKILSITTSAYGYYEQGRNQPSLETLYAIANKFQVSIDYLLGITDIPNIYKQQISENMELYDSELVAIQLMKDNHLLEEISKEPSKNVERLVRVWKFLQDDKRETDEKA